ncbi:MAG: argininosuccinate lyase [Treponema sp.]|nr:argininosuccinate lyase [Treponema sp.]
MDSLSLTHGTHTEDNHAALWHGRFSEGPDAQAVAFETSLSVDERMVFDDIRGSVAHAQMLSDAGIISPADAAAIISGLAAVERDLRSGALTVDCSAEDIHSFIEAALTDRIGEAGRRVHTGRSRNDQVALDERLYLRRALPVLTDKIVTLVSVLADIAEKHTHAIMPGFTHLQHAQPVTLAHHLCAWAWALVRDVSRLDDVLTRLDASPIGAGALAGSSLPLDRAAEATLLGFAHVTENSLDTVSDRDYCIETVSALAIVQLHLSRFSEEVILWATNEFSFIELSERWSTGSSLMPQKKNPDFAELIRGRTGKVYGNLMALLTTMKALPLAYNRDMQEDKESLFSAYDTVMENVSVFTAMIADVSWRTETMRQACTRGYMNATDVADYLVKKGVPFRTAHGKAAQVVRRAIEKNCPIEQLSLEELRACSPLFDDDLFAAIALDRCVAARKTAGGPAPERVREELDALRAFVVGRTPIQPESESE